MYVVTLCNRFSHFATKYHLPSLPACDTLPQTVPEKPFGWWFLSSDESECSEQCNEATMYSKLPNVICTAFSAKLKKLDKKDFFPLSNAVSKYWNAMQIKVLHLKGASCEEFLSRTKKRSISHNNASWCAALQNGRLYQMFILVNFFYFLVL